MGFVKLPLANAGLLALLLLFPGISSAIELEITEWSVPFADTRPRDPFVAADGTVWFNGQAGDYIASFDPETGEFARVDLGRGAGPHNLVVDAAGTVYIAGNRQGWIGEYRPGGGDVVRHGVTAAGLGDPHTLVFGANGEIWFTAQQGNHVGRFDPITKAFVALAVPTSAARPYGIITDGSGMPWVALFGSNQIAYVDRERLALSTIDLPRTDARPRRLVASSNGDIWYVDYLEGYLGRYRPGADPGSGDFEELLVPGGEDAGPYGMAIDVDDRIWFVETGSTPNQLVVFDTATEAFLAQTSLPSIAVRHIYYDADRDAMWFGTDANTLVRAEIERP